MKPNIPSIIRGLKDYADEDFWSRENLDANTVMLHMTDITKTIGSIKELKNKMVLDSAAHVFASLGHDAVSNLIQLLENENTNIRICAVFAIGYMALAIKTNSYPCFAFYIENYENDDFVKTTANVLGMTNAQNERLVSALLKAIEDENEEVRRGAVFAFGFLGIKSEKIITALSQATADEVSSVREDAIYYLKCLETQPNDYPGLHGLIC